MKKYFFFICLISLLTLFLQTNIKAKTFENFQESKQYCQNPKTLEKYTKSITLDDVRDLNLKIKDSKRWYTNLFRIIVHRNINIPKKYKKKYKGNLTVITNDGTKCVFKATIRIHGDIKADHLQQLESGEILNSLNIRLNEGNIDSIVKFILLIPNTRNSDNEIFTSTLLKKIGFLSPRSKYVNLTFNGNKNKFIFQEKVTKELIENNNLTEGPIIEASQRFVWPEGEGEYFDERFAQGRMVNEAWALKNEGTFELSLIALTKFNQSISQNKHIFNLNDLNIHNNNENRLFIYDALLASMGAFHGLKPRDRKFYFDPINLNFLPIYYDGNTEIIERDNLLEVYKKEINSYQKKGAKQALELIENLEMENFHKALINSGVKLNSDELNHTIKKIKKNLKIIDNAIIDETNFNLEEKYFEKYHLDATNKKLVFFEKVGKNNSNYFIICDFKLTTCTEEKLNSDQIFKLVSGKLSRNKFEYIFISNSLKDYKYGTYNNSIKNLINNFLRINLDGSELVYSKNMKVNLDKENKKIVFQQVNTNDVVFIRNGFLKNWNISFLGVDNNKNNLENFYFNGCLIFKNVKLDSVKIYTSNTICEDAINFINSSGNIKEVNIQNSLSDGVDMDFSKIHVNKILVNNVKNDCLDLSYGNYDIEFSDLNNCGDKGISLGEKSILNSDKVLIRNTTLGFTVKDSSYAEINTLNLQNIKTCLSAYNKKQMFFGGSAKIKNYECKNFYKEANIDAYSKIFVNEY